MMEPTTIEIEEARRERCRRIVTKFRELENGPSLSITFSGAGLKEPFTFAQERAAIVDRLDLSIAADLLQVLLDRLPAVLTPVDVQA